MASQRQNEANRSNAARSTGPKTAGGKATSSRSAVRHGLAARRKRDAPKLADFMFTIGSGLGLKVDRTRQLPSHMPSATCAAYDSSARRCWPIYRIAWS
jgi:hypothetical protein